MQKILRICIVALLFGTVSLFGLNFKKVEATGEIGYEIEKRLKDSNVGGNAQEAEHDVDIDIKFTYPIAYDIKLVTYLDEKESNDENGSGVEVEFNQYFFLLNAKVTQIKLGLQEIVGPFFYKKNGDGILIVKSLKKSVLAGSYYIDNTYSGADEVFTLTLTGNLNPKLSYEAWYGGIVNSDTSSSNNGTSQNNGKIAYFLSVSSNPTQNKEYGLKIAGMSEDATSKDQTVMALFLKGESNIAKYEFAYIQIGDDGGDVSLDDSPKAQANFGIDEVGTNYVTSSRAYLLKYEQVIDNITSFKFDYFDASGTKEMKITYKKDIKNNIYMYGSYDTYKIASLSKGEKIELGIKLSF
jgi:hypothetical protein